MQAVAGELAALSISDAQPATAGVAFKCSVRDALRANLWLRCAVRVLMRLRFDHLDTDVEGGVRGGQAVSCNASLLGARAPHRMCRALY